MGRTKANMTRSVLSQSSQGRRLKMLMKAVEPSSSFVELHQRSESPVLFLLCQKVNPRVGIIPLVSSEVAQVASGERAMQCAEAYN